MQSFLRGVQMPQAISDLGCGICDPHIFLRINFAGKRGPGSRTLTQIKTHPAVLAIFIPAKAPVGDSLRR